MISGFMIEKELSTQQATTTTSSADLPSTLLFDFQSFKMALFQGYWDQRGVQSPTRVSHEVTIDVLRTLLT